MQKILFMLFFLGLSIAVKAKDNTANGNALISKQPSLSFIENKGQVMDQQLRPRTDIQFSVAALPDMRIFIGSGAIHYQFNKTIDGVKEEQHNVAKAASSNAGITHQYETYRMDVELVGANKNAEVLTEEKGDYFERYMMPGMSPYGTLANSYSKITYKDIYPNIDWVLHIASGQLEHEFIVRPGGNPADIHIKYSGITGLGLNEDGSLTARTPLGVITEKAPVTYEASGRAVKSSFVLNGNELTYKTGAYSGTLIIDPSLLWSTYFGVNHSEEVANSIVTDAAGNAYLCGQASLVSGLATSGAYQDTLTGFWNSIIAKFNSSGTLEWCTYYAGSTATNIAIDSAANIFVSGDAGSSYGLATPGAYQDTMGGFGNSEDVFLAKFNTNGALQWATYFGGASNEHPGGLTVDASGHVILAGSTQTGAGLATQGAYQTHAAGPGIYYFDAFLAKFNNDGTLVWSTYFGGESEDHGVGVATDPAGNIFMNGFTWSTTGIATAGAWQSTLQGYQLTDAFVAKFSPTGSLLWSTYYGGNKFDNAGAIATDALGNVIMTGWTTSDSGIATTGAYQASYGGAGHYYQPGDAFLVKYDSAGSMQWSTYFGGSGTENGMGLAIDPPGNIYLAGITNSHTGIATPGAFLDSCYNADTTYGLVGLLSKFDGYGSLQWATYWGGNHIDQCYGVALDTAGDIYITGYTADTINIATPGAYQDTFGGDADIFLAKFSADKGAPNAIANTIKASGVVTVYPNPTKNELLITAEFPIKQVTITDLLGKTVFSGNYATQKASLSLGQLPPGVYLLKINGSSKVFKVVKE